MYIYSTTTKPRFSDSDISELIELSSGVRCTRRDTLDPQCFRSIMFSSSISLRDTATGEKAIAFFQSFRSLLASKRLPARSDADRQLRIAITLYREALAARALNKVAHHSKVISDLEKLDIINTSAFLQGSILDLKTLSTNSPEEIFFPDLDKPIIDAHISDFREVAKYYQLYDANPKDALHDYGFASAADDTQVNILRLAALYGADEASHALRALSPINARDKARGAPRFLTIYNDLVEIEAHISLGKYGASRERLSTLATEAGAMQRGDLIGEINTLIAKSHIKQGRSSRRDAELGLEALEAVINYYAEIGNEAKVSSLSRVRSQVRGLQAARFG